MGQARSWAETVHLTGFGQRGVREENPGWPGGRAQAPAQSTGVVPSAERSDASRACSELVEGDPYNGENLDAIGAPRQVAQDRGRSLGMTQGEGERPAISYVPDDPRGHLRSRAPRRAKGGRTSPHRDRHQQPRHHLQCRRPGGSGVYAEEGTVMNTRAHINKRIWAQERHRIFL